jgi:hypothetical protein
MQRRYTALVDRVRVGASSDEVSDHLALVIRVQVASARASICGVVERFGSPSVAGANSSASCDECLGELAMMGGGGDMQGGVAHVDVVTNRDKEVGAGILPGCADAQRVGCQARCLIEHVPDLDIVSGADRSEERNQRTVVEFLGSPTCLRHVNKIA